MATTNFQQWNNAAINQETDAQYTADAQRAGGIGVDNLFPSPTANKLFYQTSTFVAAFAIMMANKGFTTSDADVNVLAAVLASIETSADQRPLQYEVPFSPTPVLDLSRASTLRIDLSGNVTSSSVINVPPAGTITTFYIVSGNPGVFSFAWPTNVPVINYPRNVQTESIANLFVQQFISDGSGLWPVDTFEQVAYGAFLAFQAAQVTINVNQSAENTGLTNLANAAQGTANTALTNANTAQGSANSALAQLAALAISVNASDVTSARSFGTTFTNTSGKPYFASIIMARSAGGGGDYRLDGFLNGVVVSSNTSSSTIAGMTISVSFIVPAGSTYSANPTALQGGAAIFLQRWMEEPFSV